MTNLFDWCHFYKGRKFEFTEVYFLEIDFCCICNGSWNYNYPYGKLLPLLDYTKKCNTSASIELY